jgi:hypothetical protein
MEILNVTLTLTLTYGPELKSPFPRNLKGLQNLAQPKVVVNAG